ncbi:autotransporter domain-containing protein [Pseudomonas sp. S75]|uniref:autotransporter family protein n=1 Tax=unclassified Pseudomonas TaxID=196821 RepID=UPI00190314D2|nr:MULTISPECIES: autotransporter outer membrane beta-barrel domain-containing protein [unclassified Pseudomonas]MBJ9976093.1 autotransporter domain-containing protein [Pseudomonas sp. S30]MBK0153485.1 autotransporter domain-containing protein [Pseudomonas sp. S75]
MTLFPLRRSLLALSVAAVSAPLHAAPAPDLNYDLSSGDYRVSGAAFNNATFFGTSQNTGVSMTSTSLTGDLSNRGTINRAASGPGDFPTGISLLLNSTVAGNIVNEGAITVSGEAASGLDLYGATITGEVNNNGSITVTGKSAEGMLITSTQARINNTGTIIASGVDSAGIELDNASFTGYPSATTNQSYINNSGTVSAEGVGIHVVSMTTSNRSLSITQTSGLIEGGQAAIQVEDNVPETTFYWRGGTVKGDIQGLTGVLVKGDVQFDGSTLRSKYVDIAEARLTLLRPQTTIVGDLDLDSDAARLRLLLDNTTRPDAAILKVTGNTFFAQGSQIELQARSDDFRTPTQGTRYTLINSGTWEEPGNLSVVSSSALLEVKTFGIEGQDVKATVVTRSDETITQELEQANGSANAIGIVKPLKNSLMAQLDDSDPVFQQFASAATAQELARLSETLTPDVSRGVIHAATNSQNLVANTLARRASAARDDLSADRAQRQKGVWLQALSSDADQDRRHGVDGYAANSHGIAVGADGKLDADTTLGLAYSYLSSNVKSDLGHKTDVTGHALTLYGNWRHDNLFVDTSLMYGWNDNASKRSVAGTRAKADYDSEIFGVNALVGYTLRLDGQWLLEPQVGARYARVSIDAYREKGSSAALDVGSQRYEIGEMGAGARLAAAFAVGAGSLEPEARLMAWHDFIADRVGTTSTFVLGGTPFTTQGATPARDSYELGLGANYRLGAWSVGGTYNHVASSGFDADNFTANVRYAF